MKITPEVRATALEWAERRCECTGSNCRHHLRDRRCKKGLRGDQWKVYWRKEDGGATRENVSAWCLSCFANNFEVPRETVALFAPEIAGYARMLEEDPRRAVTVRSVLRDAAREAARKGRGRMVLDRWDDDILVEMPSSRDAIEAARALNAGFQALSDRLDLSAAPLLGAIHLGEVTRWRNGLLVGDALDVALSLRAMAPVGQILVTEPVVQELRGTEALDAVPQSDAGSSDLPEVWSLTL